MTSEQTRLRDWYYGVCVRSLHNRILAWMRSREKDRFAMVDSLLTACEKDPAKCAELIDQECDRLRYINWKCDKKGKPISCDVVWSDSDEYRKARHDAMMKKHDAMMKSSALNKEEYGE